jgi:hypothetical protein
VGIALLVGTLQIVPSASTSAAAAASCPAVTHGTLADVVALPGLIVAADEIALRQGDTPAVDKFAVTQVIRPEVPDQGFDLRAGVLTVPSNDCWQGLRTGDRIIAIFPSPDTLVAERSVAWRVGPGDRVEQTSSQDVTGVPTSATALIDTLEVLVAGVPATSTDLPNADQSPPPEVAGNRGPAAPIVHRRGGLPPAADLVGVEPDAPVGLAAAGA